MAATMKVASSPLHATLASPRLVKTRAPCCSLNDMGAPSRTSRLSTSCRATKLHSSPTCQEDQSAFKVFADDNTGVVCYNNEHGEMVCEGLDEGPHFDPQLGSKDGPSSTYVPEDQAAEILPVVGQPMYEI